MSPTFSLTPEDFRLFQRAAALRFRALHGRLGVPFLLQVSAWLCVGLSTTAFLRLWQQDPEATRVTQQLKSVNRDDSSALADLASQCAQLLRTGRFDDGDPAHGLLGLRDSTLKALVASRSEL